MALDVKGLVLGMELLEPGFHLSKGAQSIGCLSNLGVQIDDRIAGAIDAICKWSELERIDVDLPDWMDAYQAGSDVLHVEAVQSNRHLLKDQKLSAMLSSAVRARLSEGAAIPSERYRSALAYRPRWQSKLDAIFSTVDVLILPSVGFFAVPLEEAFDHTYTHLTMPINLAGNPAVAIPIPIEGSLPASLQLVGRCGDEERLLATALQIERVIASGSRN